MQLVHRLLFRSSVGKAAGSLEKFASLSSGERGRLAWVTTLPRGCCIPPHSATKHALAPDSRCTMLCVPDSTVIVEVSHAGVDPGVRWERSQMESASRNETFGATGHRRQEYRAPHNLSYPRYHSLPLVPKMCTWTRSAGESSRSGPRVVCCNH